MSLQFAPGTTIDDLRRAFSYDAGTGILTWQARPLSDFASKNAWAVWNAKHAGKPAGWLDSNRYRLIRFRGRCLKGSRVAWAIVTGEIAEVIDHQDGDTTNDRIANLRDVSAAENARNRARAVTNRTGATGVYVSRGKRYSAQINVDGKRKYLGTYPDFETATRIRKEAEAIYGFHRNHDRPGTREE